MSDTSSFNARLPVDLRNRLSTLAEAAGRSVNAEVVARLARSVHGGHSRELFEAFDLPKTLRLASTSTGADAERLLTVCTELEADQVVLAARRDDLNDAVLVAIVTTPVVTCIMDRALLNLARPPRIAEVQRLFRKLDALGLLHSAVAIADYVEPTSHLEPFHAVHEVLKGLRRRLHLPDFLALLGNGQRFDEAAFRMPPQASPGAGSD